jgi:hypothetical protein
MNDPANVVILGDMRDLHHHGCEAVMSRLSAGLVSSGLIQPHVLPGLDWRPYVDLCMNADLVVINGEGALHHSRPAVSDVLELAEKRALLKKATALVNTSWFHNTPGLTARLKSFDLVATRDKKSADEIALHAPSPRVVPDLAIIHAIIHSAGDRGKNREGFMASDSTTPAITRRLRHHAKIKGWYYLPVLAYPLQPRPGNKSRKIYRRCCLYAKLGPIGRLISSTRYHAHLTGVAETDEYLSRLSSCRGVMTGRYHSVCFAIGQKTPFLALASNTPKIESLLTDAGLSARQRMIKPSDMGQISEIPQFTESELAALDEFTLHAKNAASSLFKDLALLATARRQSVG